MEPNEWQKKKNNKTTEYTQRITSQARIAVVLRAKCKNVANKMQKIGFKKRHFKRLLNAK